MARIIYPISRNYKGSVVKPRYFGSAPGGSQAASQAFSPSQISGLELWLKADAITGLNDADPVATWPDSSGKGRDATQSVAGNKPIYKVNIQNGKPVVRFNGSSNFMNLPDFLTGFSAGEICLVIKLNNDPPTAGSGGLWEFGSDTLASHYCFTDGTIYDAFGTNARKTTVNPTPTLAAWRLYNVSSASAAWTSRLDTTQLFTTATNTVAWTTAPKFGGSGTFFTDGDIAEIVLYSSVLGSADRTSLQNYLRDKYALSF